MTGQLSKTACVSCLKNIYHPPPDRLTLICGISSNDNKWNVYNWIGGGEHKIWVDQSNHVLASCNTDMKIDKSVMDMLVEAYD